MLQIRDRSRTFLSQSGLGLFQLPLTAYTPLTSLSINPAKIAVKKKKVAHITQTARSLDYKRKPGGILPFLVMDFLPALLPAF